MKQIFSTSSIRHMFTYLPVKYMLDFYDENSEWLKTPFGVYIDEGQENAIVMLAHYLFISADCKLDFIKSFFDEVINDNLIKELGVVFLFYDNSMKSINVSSLSEIYSRCSIKPFTIDRLLYQYQEETEATTNTVIKISDAFCKGYEGLDLIIEEVESTGTYKSINGFLEKGLGYTFVKNNKIEGFCTTEYPSKNAIAFGIMVNDEYQRNGYGKCMAKHLVLDIKKENPQKSIYWDCFKGNLASSKTAQSSGFKLINDYKVFFLPLREKDK